MYINVHVSLWFLLPQSTVHLSHEQPFAEERAQDALRRMRRRMEDSDVIINNRNKKRDVAFEYFLSKNIVARVSN